MAREVLHLPEWDGGWYVKFRQRKPAGLLLVTALAGGIGVAQSPPPAPQVPVATVSGQPVYEHELLPLVQAQLRQIRNQEHEIKKRALENLIHQRLLGAEARKKGVTAEQLLPQAVDSGAGEPSDAEVEAFYLGQRDRLAGSFDQMKAQLRQNLKQARLQERRQQYLKRLWEEAQVTILLRPPRVEVAYDSARLRGRPDAPVIIVEFADFQCGYCRTVQPVLKGLLARYGGQVSLGFRDYPLQNIHPQAQAAAEAARRAGEQGKFWEYHDLLFLGDASSLGAERLNEHARTLELDAGRFKECLSSGKHRAQVASEVQDAMKSGVAGTPAFFINGIFLDGAQPPAAFEQIIDAELAAVARSRAVSKGETR